jgi:hypothetical protein
MLKSRMLVRGGEVLSLDLVLVLDTVVMKSANALILPVAQQTICCPLLGWHNTPTCILLFFGGLLISSAIVTNIPDVT